MKKPHCKTQEGKRKWAEKVNIVFGHSTKAGKRL